MKQVRITIVILFCCMIPAFCFSQAQRKSTDPAQPETINFSADNRQIDKPIPFDKPFNLLVDKIDVERVKKVFAYKIVVDKNGKRYPANLDIKSSCNKADIELKFEPKDKNLLIGFEPVKPNQIFDVAIKLKISDEVFNLYAKVMQNIEDRNDIDGLANYKSISKALTNLTPRGDTLQLNTLIPANYDDFKTSPKTWPALKPFFEKAIDESKLQLTRQVILTSLTQIIKLTDDNKLSFINLLALKNFVESANNTSLAYGYKTMTNVRENANMINFKERVKNIDSTIGLLNTIHDLLTNLYAKTADNSVLIFDTTFIQFNIKQLFNNADVLKESYNEMYKIINNTGTSEVIWLTATTQIKDLETKSASLLSTEIGLTNVVARNNNNDYKYIPKIFIGLNIFFRPVNRNEPTKYLSKRKRPFNSCDNLSAFRTPLHRWNLSVGLTLGGSLNTSQLQNLYNNMSLTLGPSYRFAQAFRISGGIALLKRQNPNPLIMDSKITTGLYGSLSVDLAFAKVVQSFIDLLK